MESTPTKKPWYKKPENVLVYGGLAALGWGALNVLDKVLPLLNRVLESLLYTSVLGVTLAIVGFLIVNGDLHRLMWFGYKSAMRWLTGLVIELDPIGIMKTYVGTLKNRLNEIRSGLADLRAQAMRLEGQIREKTASHERSMRMAQQAKARVDEAGMRIQVQLHARKAGRAEKSTLTFQGLLNKVKRHIAVMEKIEEASVFMIEDINDTIIEESEKRDAIHASYEAMSAAKRILAADKQREMYDMALESNVRDYYTKLGEITQFMEDSQHFIQTMDLENGMYEEEALQKLEAWEQRSATLMEGGSGNTKYRVAPAEMPAAEEEQAGNESYASLFGSLDK